MGRMPDETPKRKPYMESGQCDDVHESPRRRQI
jgi:hypothetical protein